MLTAARGWAHDWQAAKDKIHPATSVVISDLPRSRNPTFVPLWAGSELAQSHNAGCSPHTASGQPWTVDVVVEFTDERRGCVRKILEVWFGRVSEYSGCSFALADDPYRHWFI